MPPAQGDSPCPAAAGRTSAGTGRDALHCPCGAPGPASRRPSPGSPVPPLSAVAPVPPSEPRPDLPRRRLPIGPWVTRQRRRGAAGRAVAMSARTLPLLFLNLGGEMLYILDQRLRAQSIPGEKARKGERRPGHPAGPSPGAGRGQAERGPGGAAPARLPVRAPRAGLPAVPVLRESHRNTQRWARCAVTGGCWRRDGASRRRCSGGRAGPFLPAV